MSEVQLGRGCVWAKREARQCAGKGDQKRSAAGAACSHLKELEERRAEALEDKLDLAEEVVGAEEVPPAVPRSQQGGVRDVEQAHRPNMECAVLRMALLTTKSVGEREPMSCCIAVRVTHEAEMIAAHVDEALPLSGEVDFGHETDGLADLDLECRFGSEGDHDGDDGCLELFPVCFANGMDSLILAAKA
jgi:hypothetical protein